MRWSDSAKGCSECQVDDGRLLCSFIMVVYTFLQSTLYHFESIQYLTQKYFKRKMFYKLDFILYP